MKKAIIALLLSVIFLSSCTSIEKFEPTIESRVKSGIEEGVQATISKYTEVPTNTPLATYTSYPTLTPNPTYTPEIILVTATYTSTPKFTPTITMTPTNTATLTSTPDVTMMDKSDGFYLVNAEIAPGVWRSNGTQDDCYWEITTSTGDIISNHFGMAGGTMFIPNTAFQVMLEDCGIWTYMGD